MDTRVFNGREYATDKELVEAVAATLELPNGLVDDEGIDRWRAGLEARGWTVAERTDSRYRLEHAASGFLADLQLLRYDPADPQRPILDAATGAEAQLRLAFSTARLSAPAGNGLLADANLMTPGADDAIVWLITHTGASQEDATDATATASPFLGTSHGGGSTASRLFGGGATAASRLFGDGATAQGTRTRALTVLAVSVTLLVAVALLPRRRSKNRRRGRR